MAPQTAILHFGDILTTGGTQIRAAMDEEVVQSYAFLLIQDADFQFPPLTVFYDGVSYWLADGFHRHSAYSRAYRMEVPVEIHQGTKRDALRYALSANVTHGLNRTNADKRRAVEIALKDEEWGGWSDSQIAKLCGVHHQLVGRLRASLDDSSSEVTQPQAGQPAPVRTYTTKHGTTATMKTGRIGKGKKTKQAKQDDLPVLATEEKPASTLAEDPLTGRLSRLEAAFAEFSLDEQRTVVRSIAAKMPREERKALAQWLATLPD